VVGHQWTAFTVQLFYEDFINIERIAAATMITLQTPGVDRSKLDAPEAD
jgi:hypothetical protein